MNINQWAAPTILLNECILTNGQHPDYEEEEAPEWLVGVPDPSLAEEWEMLSFYRFVHIDQPDAFANMLQVCLHMVVMAGLCTYGCFESNTTLGRQVCHT